MNKKFFKLMAVTAALTGLASCSDDLGLTKSSVQKGDLTATFETSYEGYTRLGMLEKDGNNPWAAGDAAGWGWVFTQGDKVRVWSLEAMTYEVYNLTGGVDTPNGVFEKDEASKSLEANKERWAITDAQFAYGLSPNDEGTPVLTYTIPYQYYANSHESATGAADENVRQFPAPFWGQAALDSDGKIDVNFRALTAFLRIEMATLPDDAKYIVLTTHGDATTEDGGATIDFDGFQLVSPDPTQPWAGSSNKVKLANGELADYNDNLTFWEQVDTVTAGTGEALTGTFNTTLVDNKSALGVDKGLEGAEYDMAGISRLVTRDEMVIDVQKFKANNPDGVFWIPIIAQHYNELYVMAVTEKSKYAYKYVGTMLKDYYDWTPKVGGRYRLTMNLENLGKSCAYKLNKAIKAINKENKYKLAATNIINVDELGDCKDHWYYRGGKLYHSDDVNTEEWEAGIPADQVLVQGTGDLELNIAAITAVAAAKGGWSPVRNDLETYAATGKTEVLYVSDYNYNTGVTATGGTKWSSGIAADNKNAVKSVKINMPAEWAGESDGDAKALLSDLPLYDAIFAANNNYASAQQPGAQYLDIYAYGSATEWMSASELSLLKNGSDLEINNILKSTAKPAISVINGIRSLEVKSTTIGDVSVYNGAGAQVEINDKLTIKTIKGINVRVDNALVDKVYFQETSNKENYLISQGSAAYRIVNVDGDDADDPADAKKPNRLTLLSYWTGYALDADALNVKNYDTGTIYTVAQLASMGEEIDGSETNEYKVNDLLEDMWLGGSVNPWLGPQVTIKGFQFDGNGIALKKMTMPLLEKDAVAADTYDKPVYTYDPHICCTTCGFNRDIALHLTNSGTASVPLTSYGLIRSIKSNGSDENIIKNVKLNDVYFLGKNDAGTDVSVTNNVGSVVGLVAIGSAPITFDNNEVGEVQIELNKNNFIGGLAGYIQTASDIVIDRNRVGNSTDFQYGTGYVRGNNYVGGLVGQIGTSETSPKVDNLQIIDTKVELGKNILAATNFAGGLVGRTFTKTKVEVESTSVKTPKIQAKQYAAGNIGYLVTDDALVKDVTVTVDDINASNNYAAGLIAYNKVKNVLDAESADIKIKNTLNATNGFAGGEVAYSYYGRINVGKNITEEENYATSIAIGTIKGAYDLGGIIGNNDNNADVYVLAGIKDNDDDTYKSTINIAINQFVNSKGNTVEKLYTYFNPEGAEDISHLAGTISNVAGRVDGKLYINELNLTVADKLQSDMKIKIGYQNRPSQKHAGTPERFFWGDYNGYVGWGKSGNYYLTDASSDDDVLQDAHNQVTGDQEGFNLYREKGDDYKKESKNAI